MAQFHSSLRRFEKRKKSGVIIEVKRYKSKGRLSSNLGCLRVEFKTRSNDIEVFWTKLRKGLRLRVNKKISIWTTHLHASAYRYDLNVVGIDLDGLPAYRWTPKEGLVSYDGSGV